MRKIISGIIGGLVATIVISILMLIKTKLGWLPALNPIADNATLMGSPHELLIGWVIHFIVGSLLWGILFAFFSMVATNISATSRGLLFGILAWIAMMLVFMPIAGHGLFASNIGIAAMIMSLIMHLIYGLVLGFVYGLVA